MKYAIIGSGKIGTALARHFAQNKVPVAVANSRGPASLASLVAELGKTIVPVTIGEALEAEIIILAVPFASLLALAPQARTWHGKLVIDAMNAFGISPATIGGDSTSEYVARTLPGARVVKAFNHLPAAILARDPLESGGRRAIFVSSNEAEASTVTADLAQRLGFAAIQLGALRESAVFLDVKGPQLGALLLQNVVKFD